jgi:hypothetical protein
MFRRASDSGKARLDTGVNEQSLEKRSSAARQGAKRRALRLLVIALTAYRNHKKEILSTASQLIY